MLAALITALLGGIAGIITALQPILLSKPSPISSPPTLIATAPPFFEDSCKDYFNPDHLPVYNLQVGIHRSIDIDSVHTLTEPFAIEFIDGSITNGGMKVEYDYFSDTFSILSNVDGNCNEIFFEGGNLLLQNVIENQLKYGERFYRFTLAYDEDQRILIIDLRRE
ncbi:MAG: hypothetical protein KKD28_04060 [Chloroflexi bacterium]|nr:hypothetical protein [Chloroflexota bacterium]MBU1660628.1 hypothetical protein [Chloroflexota bacterium]